MDRSSTLPPERVGNDHALPHSRTEHIGRALAAVGDRQLLGLGSAPAEPLGQPRCRLARGKNALEASRGCERAHGIPEPAFPPREARPPRRRASRAASRMTGLRERGRASRLPRPRTPRSPGARSRRRSHAPWRLRKRSTAGRDRKSTRLNSSHLGISYAVFCLKKKKKAKATHIHEEKKEKKIKDE